MIEPSRKLNIPESSSGRNPKQYNGFYLGIVVQNNDPDKAGKVKVFIPHISPTVYDGWNSINEDKRFKFIGENISSDLSNIIEELKIILPWAECASPLGGGDSSGRYHATSKVGSISDGQQPDLLRETDPVLTGTSLNMDGIGESTGDMFEHFRVSDAFNDNKNSNDGNIISGIPNKINKHAFNYTPSTYSNCAKGFFSIPNVGAHVWIFFREGDPMNPVYFASSFGQTDWAGIFKCLNSEGIDYPNDYENIVHNEQSPDSDVYRNKAVWNQKGGSIEIVNTDNRELLKMTHFSGSFFEFNNESIIQFASRNDSKLVQEDMFLTVRGDRSEYSDGEFDLIVRGDHFRKIGNFNKDKFQEWKNIVDEIANTKQLFETRRTAYVEPSSGEVRFVDLVAPSQKKSGVHAPCPVCTAGNREDFWEIINKLDGFTKLEGQPPLIFGEGAANVTSNFTNVNPPERFQNVSASINPAVKKKPTGGAKNFLNDGNCPVCGGTGLSPSTENGQFTSENKDQLVKDQLTENIGQLAKIEQELGLGGSEIIHITKHKTETIGLLLNDFPSVRVDEKGKSSKYEVSVLNGGVVNLQKPSPLIEKVHVDDLPGGTYSLNVCNRMNVLVGAGGIDFKSIGETNIGGVITNIAGQQVNVSSEKEVNIYAEKRLTLVSDMLTLRQKNYGQIVVDSNLGVAQNVVIGGQLHVEGEVTLNHVTAPMEIQETEETVLQGYIPVDEVSAKLYQITSGGSPAPIFANGPVRVNIRGHSHQFRNLPLTLTNSSEDVRKVGKGALKKEKGPAAPVVHEKKGGNSSDSRGHTAVGTSL